MDYKKDVLNSLKDMLILIKKDDFVEVKAMYGPSKPTRIPFYIE